MSLTSGSFAGGTGTGASTANAIRDAVDAHSNWTIVENGLVVGSETWHVLKSAAAGNALGIDWHLVVGYVTTPAANVLVKLTEEWNATTDVASKYAFSNSASALAADNTLGGTVALSDTTTLGRLQLPTGSTGTPTYNIVVNANRVMVLLGQASNGYYFYAGMYERGPALTSGEAPVTLCLTGTGTAVTPVSSVSIGYMTRHPKRTAGSTMNGRHFVMRMMNNALTEDPYNGTNNPVAPHVWPQGGVNLGADQFNSKLEAAKVMVATEPQYGGLLGYFKDVVVTRGPAAGIAIAKGDTITIGSGTYVFMADGCSAQTPESASQNPVAMWANTAD